MHGVSTLVCSIVAEPPVLNVKEFLSRIRGLFSAKTQCKHNGGNESYPRASFLWDCLLTPQKMHEELCYNFCFFFTVEIQTLQFCLMNDTFMNNPMSLVNFLLKDIKTSKPEQTNTDIHWKMGVA